MDNNNPQFPIRFPVLPASQYITVLDRTSERVRAQLRPPEEKNYRTKSASVYPRWFMALIGLVLFVVMIFSFFVSAGKQAAAMGLLLDDLPSHFNHLSSYWANLSIVFMLGLSELGTVLFLIVAVPLARNVSPLSFGPISFNPMQLIFRLFAILCAAYAIVANTTITALDTVREAVVLQWLVTLGIPALVLGLGMILERMVIASLETRGEANLQYEKARREYTDYFNDPMTHPNYPIILADMLYQEMYRVRSVQAVMKQLVDTDPRYKSYLISAEYKMQQEAGRIDVNIDVSAWISSVTIDTPQLPARSVSRGVSRPKAKQAKIGPGETAKKWLASNPDHGLSVREAARAANVTPATMQRAMDSEGNDQ
jgi:hypothetical protein